MDDNSFTPGERAAIITGINEESVNLQIFGLLVGGMFRDGVRQDEKTKAPGTWHWPERI